jgi:hypothetical protein
MLTDEQRREKARKIAAFVEGAALHAAAVGYWVGQREPFPTLLGEFIAERIENYCGEYAWRGFAGRRWADNRPLDCTIAETIREAARRAGLTVADDRIAAACARHGVKPDDRLHVVAGLSAEIAAEAAQQV